MIFAKAVWVNYNLKNYIVAFPFNTLVFVFTYHVLPCQYVRYSRFHWNWQFVQISFFYSIFQLLCKWKNYVRYCCTMLAWRLPLIAIVSKDLNINVRTITEIYVYVVYNGSKSRTLLIKVTMSRSSVALALRQYTITALGRGEYPKLSTPLGLFPSGFPEGFSPREITLVGLTILNIHRFRGP